MDLASKETKECDRFLWLAPFAPPKGFTQLPDGGMCLSVFLFVIQSGRLLLGKYGLHPAWETLAGMETKRVEANHHGMTLPASHLKFGEAPLEAAHRIGEEILTLPKGLMYSGPFVKTFFYEPMIAPGKMHFDVTFFYDVALPENVAIHTPPWYASLEWVERDKLTIQNYARQHGDVVAAWLDKGP
jgi:hypothetical protein